MKRIFIHFDMKHILVYLFTFALLAACSKSRPEDKSFDPHDGGSYDEHAVSLWNEEDYEFDRYYSSIDITPVNFAITPPHVRIYFNDGEDPQVTWAYNGRSVEPASALREWNESLQKWSCFYSPILEGYTAGYFHAAVGDTFHASVLLYNGKKVTRNAIIKENKIEGDYFGVKFGMTVEEVKKAEQARCHSSLSEIAPGKYRNGKVSYLNSSLITTGYTIYVFQNNSLEEIGEYFYYSPSLQIEEIPEIESALLPCMRYLGFSGSDIFDNKTGNLMSNYSWVKGKLSFTLQQRSDILYNNPFAGIFITKK